MTKDAAVQRRKEQLIEEANIILDAIKAIGPDDKDPLTDPETLTKAVKLGILDAPQLKGNPACSGALNTRVISGALYAYDNNKKEIITEQERIRRILSYAETK